MIMAGKKKNKDDDGKPGSPYVRNRRAWSEYHILEKLECGMVLTGTEVKSIRDGGAKIGESYVRLEGSELYLVGANISPYRHSRIEGQHNPARKRKLLAHGRQIAALKSHVQQKGKTLVPLAIYFHKGRAKLEVGLAEGKREHDKRDTLRKKQQKRDIDREMRRGSR